MSQIEQIELHLHLASNYFFIFFENFQAFSTEAEVMVLVYFQRLELPFHNFFKNGGRDETEKSANDIDEGGG